MKRRTFIAILLGSSTLSLQARAQRNGKPPVIGFIGANNEAIDRPRLTSSITALC